MWTITISYGPAEQYELRYPGRQEAEAAYKRLRVGRALFLKRDGRIMTWREVRPSHPNGFPVACGCDPVARTRAG